MCVRWLRVLLLASLYQMLAGALMYPKGGVCKLIVGLGIPVDQPKRVLSLGINFQFQYLLPQNVTELKQYPEVQRTAREMLDRPAVYASLQDLMDSRGVRGRSCLLRSICEVAETPMMHSGLIGELLHILLTPGYGFNTAERLDSEYHHARRLGERGEDCRLAYPSCPLGHGLLDSITTLNT